MKRTVLISIALITAGFLTAVAQNDISMPKKYPGEKTIFESPNFETLKLPAIKKAKSGQDWWEPDTVYAISPVTNESRIEERFTNKYNSHGLLTERIGQLRGVGPAYPDSSWIDDFSSSYTYTYDSNNNILTLLEEQRREYIRPEISFRLYTYTYDSNNNVLTDLQQNWGNNSWENSSLRTYTYDSNNNVLTKLEQKWENNLWENEYLYTYTYDSNNNKLTELRQWWKYNSWLDLSFDSHIYTYTYDSNNNVLTRLVDNDILYTYTYDSNNNRLTELMQLWRTDSWENYFQNLMTYDENGNGTSVETWRWWGEIWSPVNNLNSYIFLFYNNMQTNFQWSGCHKLTASYINVTDLTAIVTPSSTSDLNAISIYPNPTRGELRITNYKLRITDIQVFDMAGVQVLHTQQTTLDISHLPAGIYFVQIKTEKGAVTKKIVKL